MLQVKIPLEIPPQGFSQVFFWNLLEYFQDFLTRFLPYFPRALVRFFMELLLRSARRFYAIPSASLGTSPPFSLSCNWVEVVLGFLVEFLQWFLKEFFQFFPEISSRNFCDLSSRVSFWFTRTGVSAEIFLEGSRGIYFQVAIEIFLVIGLELSLRVFLNLFRSFS